MKKMFVYMTTNAPAQWQKYLYMWLKMHLRNDKNVYINWLQMRLRNADKQKYWAEGPVVKIYCELL